MQSLCQSLPNAIRLGLLDDIGAMVFHDPVPKLPNELMLHIFSHLSPKDLLTSSAVSRPWRDRTHDEQLWRDCFAREGWAVDRLKMLDPEELAKRKGAKVAERLMRVRKTGRAEKKGKPSLTRRDSRKRGRSEAFSDNESTMVHAGGPLEDSSDTDGAMEGVESTELGSIANGKDREGSQTVSHIMNNVEGDIDPPTDTPGLQIQPLLFSDAAEPKLSWPYLYKHRRRLESNWDSGKYKTFRLPHPEYEDEGHIECVYTIQHHGQILVSGSRDKSIRIWDLNSCRLQRTLKGHEASVLCLQFDPRPGEQRDVIISGGSDNLVIVWRFSTGEILHRFEAHNESVLNLRFDDRYLITCSKDKTIRIWNRYPILPNDPLVPARVRSAFMTEFDSEKLLPAYTLLDTLIGHQAAVNAVQINGDVIVSASGDRTIKSWDIHTGAHKKSFSGHTKGIACVQFDGRRVVSGSSDNSVRIFDYETTAEVACLEGHNSLVRTVQARFGDLDITTDEELLEQSREADKNFFKALQRGGEVSRVSGHQRNSGSSRPEEMLSYGTKIPPGGGGSKWGRIVSGSYDESVIIWKRDKDGKWKPNQRLNQAAGQSIPRQQTPQGAQNLTAIQQAQQVIQQATNTIIQSNTLPPNPAIAGQHAQHSALTTIANNLNAQMAALQNMHPAAAAPVAVPAMQAQPGQGHVPAAQPTAPNAVPGGGHHHHHHHHHNHAARSETNRVFKLQFDARRIISCSQNKVVVGWDFANGDVDLEMVGDWCQETA